MIISFINIISTSFYELDITTRENYFCLFGMLVSTIIAGIILFCMFAEEEDFTTNRNNYKVKEIKHFDGSIEYEAWGKTNKGYWRQIAYQPFDGGFVVQPKYQTYEEAQAICDEVLKMCRYVKLK